MISKQAFQIKKITIFWLMLIIVIIFRLLANTLELEGSINTLSSQVINILVCIYGLYLIAEVVRYKHVVDKNAALTILVFCWYLLSLLLSDYYATGEIININIYMLIFVVGILLNNKLEISDYTKYLNWLSGLFVYLSLLIYFLGYGMYGTGEDARFMGLDTHPSYCGFIIAVYMILNFRKNIIVQIIPIFLMTITMAKTAIGSVVLCYGIFLLIMLRQSRWKQLYRVRLPIIAIILYGVFLAIQDNIDWTFTGRTTIWEYSINAYTQSKSFLLGIGTAYMSDWVGQAHNQFIQSIVSNGIFGLAAIIMLLIILFRKTWKIFEIDNNYEPLLIWVLLFMRCLTEAPFKLLSIDAVSFPILFLILLPYSKYKEGKKDESFTYNE